MSGKKAKAARKARLYSKTDEQKYADLVTGACNYYSRILNGMTIDKAFPAIGDITCKTLFWLERIAQMKHGTFVKEFGQMLVNIGEVELGERPPLEISVAKDETEVVPEVAEVSAPSQSPVEAESAPVEVVVSTSI